MKILSLLAGLLLVASTAVSADEHEAAISSEKPSFTASRTATLNTKVEAINHETREVTLSTGEGESVTFIASKDVRNLASVEVGDLVLAELFEEVSVSVHEGEGVMPGAGGMAAAGRAEEGEKPAGMAMNTVVITAKVVDIDIEKNTFKLLDAQGHIKEFTAQNPDNLRRSSVGDMVVISITQALGVLVEHPPAG
jgi:hypothetical protein